MSGWRWDSSKLYDELDEEGQIGRTRRDRLKDAMPDWKREKRDRPRTFKSKPKGFNHRRDEHVED